MSEVSGEVRPLSSGSSLVFFSITGHVVRTSCAFSKEALGTMTRSSENEAGQRHELLFVVLYMVRKFVVFLRVVMKHHQCHQNSAGMSLNAETTIHKESGFLSDVSCVITPLWGARFVLFREGSRVIPHDTSPPRRLGVKQVCTTDCVGSRGRRVRHEADHRPRC